MDNKKDSLAPDIGRRIAIRRNQLGLTQAEAAELSGLTQQFFASVETGKKNMRADSIIRVSKALKVSTDFLLTGSVTDFERTRLAQMLEPLDETQLQVVEEIIKNVLKFGGYPIES